MSIKITQNKVLKNILLLPVFVKFKDHSHKFNLNLTFKSIKKVCLSKNPNKKILLNFKINKYQKEFGKSKLLIENKNKNQNKNNNKNLKK